MIYAAIICLILLIYVDYRIVICDDDIDARIGYLACSMTLVMLLTTLSYIYIDSKHPSALDVYRGKTELEITKTFVNDSINKCDTIVVFKK